MKFSHIGLTVSNLPRSLAFYLEGLDFELSHSLQTSDDRVAAAAEIEPPVAMESHFLVRDGLRLELMGWTTGVVGAPSRVRNQLGLTHLSFYVRDLQATTEKLQALGGELLPATHTRFESEGDVMEVVFVADPDGTRIELLSVLDGQQ